MILRAKADSLELDAGENGWSLIAETDEGDTIVLNIQGAAYAFASSHAFWEFVNWRTDNPPVVYHRRLAAEGDHLG